MARGIALGIDTSSPAGSVGLFIARSPSPEEISLPAPGPHAERLLPIIESLLAGAGLGFDRIDLFVVAAGPGSFTGLRIGMATAKGLALAAGKPVVGLSTLETIAADCHRSEGGAGGRAICVLLDAGRGEVYRGLYRSSGGSSWSLTMEGLAPEAAVPPEQAIPRGAGPLLVCGDGLAAFRDRLRPLIPEGSVLVEAPAPIGAALAGRGLALAVARGWRDMPPLVPNYLRMSDAERGTRR